jgi:hypothetical protein
VSVEPIALVPGNIHSNTCLILQDIFKFSELVYHYQFSSMAYNNHQKKLEFSVRHDHYHREFRLRYSEALNVLKILISSDLLMVKVITCQGCYNVFFPRRMSFHRRENDFLLAQRYLEH